MAEDPAAEQAQSEPEKRWVVVGREGEEDGEKNEQRKGKGGEKEGERERQAGRETGIKKIESGGGDERKGWGRERAFLDKMGKIYCSC